MKLTPLLLSALLALPLLAQQQITVGVDRQGKDPISLSRLAASGANGELFKRVLQNDLERSGFFYIDPNAQTSVSGQLADTANGLNASANVAWAGRSFSWPNDDTPTAARSDARRGAHDLADQIVRRIKNKPGIASSRILFVKRSGPDNSDLFVCDADGGNITQLTFDNRAVIGPKWDTDSKNLFLTSYVSGGPVVYRTAAEPRAAKTTIARFNGLNTSAAPSPDGKSLAIILSIFGNPDLFVLDRQTGNYTRLTKTPHLNEASPVWSPDGKSILYVAGAVGVPPQLYVVDVASKQSRRVTTGGENVSPSWCRVTGRICYASRQGGKYQIAVLESISAARPVYFTTNANLDHIEPSWAPNGRHIICSRSDSPQGASLWVLDTGGDKPVQLFTQPGKWVAPAWSYR